MRRLYAFIYMRQIQDNLSRAFATRQLIANMGLTGEVNLLTPNSRDITVEGDNDRLQTFLRQITPRGQDGWLLDVKWSAVAEASASHWR